MKINGKKNIWPTTLTLGRGNPSHTQSPPSKRPTESLRILRAQPRPWRPAAGLQGLGFEGVHPALKHRLRGDAIVEGLPSESASPGPQPVRPGEGFQGHFRCSLFLF